MKNNISYYRHETGSHGHWKFKALRRKFGWAGEGRFWALNNMIAESENCWLDISDANMIESISADIDLNLKDFHEFINFLVDNVRLLLLKNDHITTGVVQETLDDVMKKRSYQKNWVKNKSNNEKDLSSIETTESNIESEFSNIEKEQSKVKESKVKESKVKESKVKESKVFTPPNGAGDKSPELITAFKKLDINSRTVFEFIRDNKPGFIDPYIAFWNLFAEKYSKAKVVAVSDIRKKKFAKRMNEEAFNFIEIIRKAGQSEILTCSNWFSFDWVFENENNYLKVLEGNYDNNSKQQNNDKQSFKPAFTANQQQNDQLNDVYATVKSAVANR